jgi:hypothetical protein
MAVAEVSTAVAGSTVADFMETGFTTAGSTVFIPATTNIALATYSIQDELLLLKNRSGPG